MLICVTGKKGSGKSSFIKIANETGNNIFIVDDFVRKLYTYNNKAYKKIIRMFGISYVNSEEINRKKLNQLMITDENAKNRWMKYINHLIYKSIKKLDKNKLWFVELGTYLLYEDYFNKIFNKIILIKANKKNLEKNNPMLYKEHISNSLDDSKINYDYLIENNGSLKEFRNNVIKFLNETNF